MSSCQRAGGRHSSDGAPRNESTVASKAGTAKADVRTS